MNPREKFQAQLELLQQMKYEFPRNVIIPQGEDFASVQSERNDKTELRVYVDFNQEKLEHDVDRQVDEFFNDFIEDIEKKLGNAMEEEEGAYFNPLKPHFGNPLGDVDELMNSIKAQLVESIKK
jgi:hypothetical protein